MTIATKAPLNRKIRCSNKNLDGVVSARIFKLTRNLLVSLAVCGGYSAPAFSEECVTSDQKLFQAKKEFAEKCEVSLKDCDKLNGKWYCSSSMVTWATVSLANGVEIENHSLSVSGASASNVVNNTSSRVVSTGEGPECIDSDGDGWGWDGVSSCRVIQGRNSLSFSSTTNNVGRTSSLLDERSSAENQRLSSTCFDPDGDGWGWNGTSSCKVSTAASNSIVLGNSDVRHGSNQDYSASAVSENCGKIDSGNYHITELVTDLFLTAGQSNATGDQTLYDPVRYKQDRVNDRVIVWTDKNKWEIANPARQIWHNGKYPGGYQIFNHPGFQIGRAIADLDECRVIAFIATAASGMPINYWLDDVDGHYAQISNKVTKAINALPKKHRVDMIWWMHGESDNDEIVARYFSRLEKLIASFRAESWFSLNGYFLANETGWSSYANEAIRMLSNDGNRYTDYSLGEDSLAESFHHRRNEIDLPTHFNAVSLRKIGDLVARKYVNSYLRIR